MAHKLMTTFRAELCPMILYAFIVLAVQNDY